MGITALGLMIQHLGDQDQDVLREVPGDEVVALIRWADGFSWEGHYGMMVATPQRVFETGLRHVFGVSLGQEPLSPGRELSGAELRRSQFSRRSGRLRRALVGRDGAECKACGRGDNLAVDHVHPISRGGSDDLDNLQLLCQSCNSSKGRRTMAEWAAARP